MAGWLMRAAGGAISACAAAAVLAQQLPGQVQPGQIERQLERPRQPQPGRPVVIPAAPEPQAPAAAQEVRFTLQGVLVEGSTVYGEAQLRPAWEGRIGREISLAQLHEIAQTLTRQYRNDGYILSQVVVPAQTIRDGTARLQAVEGFVSLVRIEGDAGDARERIERYLEPVTRSRPLHSGVLERALLLANDLAGISARGILSPSREPGASDLTINVNRSPRAFALGLNNRGSRFLGPWRFNADADFHGLLTRGDRTALRLVRTVAGDELTYVNATHERPLGADGMKLAVSAGLVEANPDVGVAFPNLQTDSVSASAMLTYPIVRSRLSNLAARAILSAHDGRSDVAGLRLTEDRIRAARIGLSWDTIDALRGINLLDVEFSHGIDAFDATHRSATGSRVNAPAHFQKATLYAARLQSLAPRWSVLAALSAQRAFTNLLAPEQFGFGGEHFGRAYDAAELLGDHGAAFKVELRFNPRGAAVLRDSMLYAFYDSGRIWRRSPQPGEAAEQSAEAIGGGWRFALRGGVSGFVEAAVPNRVVAAEGRRVTRVFAGVQVNF